MPAPTISPTMEAAVEYLPFTATFTVTFEPPDPLIIPPPPDPYITGVTIVDEDGNDYSSNVTTTIVGTDSVTVSGTLSDVFNREMYYLDSNKQSHMVTRWVDLPEVFDTLYKYKGATVKSKVLTLTVQTTEGDAVATVDIANDFETANANLALYVAKGKY